MGWAPMDWSRSAGWRSCATAATAPSACWRWRCRCWSRWPAWRSSAGPPGSWSWLRPTPCRAPGPETDKPTDNDVWLTIGIGAVLPFLLLLGKGFFVALLAPIAAIAAAWFASRWIAERIGGYTGDTLGAVQQCAEIAFLVGGARVM